MATRFNSDQQLRRPINSYDEYGIPGSTTQGRFQYSEHRSHAGGMARSAGQAWLPELGMMPETGTVWGRSVFDMAPATACSSAATSVERPGRTIWGMVRFRALVSVTDGSGGLIAINSYDDDATLS